MPIIDYFLTSCGSPGPLKHQSNNNTVDAMAFDGQPELNSKNQLPVASHALIEKSS